jgi:hypothetical protein
MADLGEPACCPTCGQAAIVRYYPGIDLPATLCLACRLVRYNSRWYPWETTPCVVCDQPMTTYEDHKCPVRVEAGRQAADNTEAPSSESRAPGYGARLSAGHYWNEGQDEEKRT